MKFYRVHVEDVGEGCQGFAWFRTKREAGKYAREHTYSSPRNPLELYDMAVEQTCDVEAVDIEPTKAGILAALKHYASHPDNG